VGIKKLADRVFQPKPISDKKSFDKAEIMVYTIFNRNLQKATKIAAG